MENQSINRQPLAQLLTLSQSLIFELTSASFVTMIRYTCLLQMYQVTSLAQLLTLSQSLIFELTSASFVTIIRYTCLLQMYQVTSFDGKFGALSQNIFLRTFLFLDCKDIYLCYTMHLYHWDRGLQLDQDTLKLLHTSTSL